MSANIAESPFPTLKEIHNNIDVITDDDEPKDVYYKSYIMALNNYYKERLNKKRDKIRQLKEQQGV